MTPLFDPDELPRAEPTPAPAPRAHHGLAPFSPSYDKARRSYGVATALLLAWALVGIELDKNPLSSVKVTLKSPEAAPYVFIAAVLYFAFRFTVEWYQADAGRRALRASRIDYRVAHALAVMAIAVFAGQKILQVQLAAVFVGVFPQIITFVFGLVSYRAVITGLRRWRRDRRGSLILVAMALAGPAVMVPFQVQLHQVSAVRAVGLLVAGAVTSATQWFRIPQLIGLVAGYIRQKL